jgi:hypothetical protein
MSSIEDRRSLGLTFGALVASSATLVCCVLPAVLVSIGAGAAVVALVTAVPQLVWLSEHKVLVFGVAALLLAGGGLALRQARRLPCPIDPRLARSCMRLRRINGMLYGLALACFLIGAAFAFVLPALTGA